MSGLYARTAVTMHHRLCETADIYRLTGLEAESLISGHQQGWSLLRAVSEVCAPGLSPWPGDGSCFVSLYIVFLLYVSASVCKFPLSLRTPSCRTRVHPNDLIITN